MNAEDRRRFRQMLVVGALIGGTVLFALTAFAVGAFARVWPPLIAVLPIAVVVVLVGVSRFWMPGRINGTSGFLLGLAIGLGGAIATCIGILQSLSHGGV